MVERWRKRIIELEIRDHFFIVFQSMFLDTSRECLVCHFGTGFSDSKNSKIRIFKSEKYL